MQFVDVILRQLCLAVLFIHLSDWRVVGVREIFSGNFDIPFSSGRSRGTLSVPEGRVCLIARKDHTLKCTDGGDLMKADGYGIGIMKKSELKAVLKYCKNGCKDEKTFPLAFIRSDFEDFKLRRSLIRRKLKFESKSGLLPYVLSTKTIDGCVSHEVVEYQLTYNYVVNGQISDALVPHRMSVFGKKCPLAGAVMYTFGLPESHGNYIVATVDYAVNDRNAIDDDPVGIALVLEKRGKVKLVDMKKYLPPKMAKGKVVGLLKAAAAIKPVVIKSRRKYLSVQIGVDTVRFIKRGTLAPVSNSAGYPERKTRQRITSDVYEPTDGGSDGVYSEAEPVRDDGSGEYQVPRRLGASYENVSGPLQRRDSGAMDADGFLAFEPEYKLLRQRKSTTDEAWTKDFIKADQKAFLSVKFPVCDQSSETNERQRQLAAHWPVQSRSSTDEAYARQIAKTIKDAGIRVVAFDFDGTLVSKSFTNGEIRDKAQYTTLASGARALVEAVVQTDSLKLWVASFQNHPFVMTSPMTKPLPTEALFAEPPLSRQVEGQSFEASGVRVTYHWPTVAVPWSQMQSVAPRGDPRQHAYRGPGLIAKVFDNSGVRLRGYDALNMIAYLPSSIRPASTAMPAELRNIKRKHSKVLTLTEIARLEGVNYDEVLLIDDRRDNIHDAIMCGFTGIHLNNPKNGLKGLGLSRLQFPEITSRKS